MRRWLNQLPGLLRFGSRGRKASKRNGSRRAQLQARRLALEPLEDRTLLAALPTLTALRLSASAVASGQPVTFTAQVSVPSSAAAAPSGGSVTFTDGATVLGTAPVVNGTATLVNSLFAVGTHSVRASYSGSGDALAGSAATVGPSVTVAGVDSGSSPSGYALPMYTSASTLGQDAGVSPMSTSSPTGMTPTQICQAYGFNTLSFGSTAANGAGETIAIVDAYDDPNIASDLQSFDQYFGLSNPSFTKVNQTGGSTPPATNTGWATEIALDVQWSHAVAPGANILLVEANSNSYSDLMTAVSYARTVSGVVAVSMSWGGGEDSGETGYDSDFTTPNGHANVTFLASSGDEGAPVSYPSASPNVVGVGGTSLYLTGQNNYSSESAWSGSGGGISAYESQPSYQKGVVTQSSSYRTDPDVSYDADPNTGFPVYDTLNNGTSAPWGQWGGTSDAAPQWAALVAIADQGRAVYGLSPLDGPTQTLPTLYGLPAGDFHDITSGTSSGTPNYSAGPGYDLVTGRGTPYANLIVPALVDAGATPTTVTLSDSSNSISYGQSVTFTATVAAQSGSAAPSQGSVSFVNSTTSVTLGSGTFGGTSGLTSTWTFVTAAKSFHVTTGDTVTATYAPGMGFAGSSGTATQTVTAIPLTVTAAASTKSYDGTTSSTIVPTITGGTLVAGDTAAFTEIYDSKNVGSGKTLGIGGSVNDGDSGSNYTLTIVTNATGLVTARAITVAAVPNTKFYDGTISATAAAAITSGSLAAGDAAAFSETFDTPNPGTGKTLTPAGSVNDGNGGNNYAVAFAAIASGTILTSTATNTTVSSSQASVAYGTPLVFTATVGALVGSVAPGPGSVDFFDATTNSDLGLGLFGGSAGTISTWTLATGAKTFNATVGDTITATYTAGANFGGSSGATTQTVAPLAITVTAATSTKVYDGTTSATATPAITGGSLVTGDTAVFSESFNTRNAGAGRTLVLAGSVSDGNSGKNYAVTLANTAGSIIARAITVVAVTDTKVYDGTTSAAILPSIASGSLAAGDTAAFSETFDSKNAGAGKTLTASGSVGDGNGGSNYTVTLAANTTGSIAPRAITVAATTNTKVYDGTTASAATPMIVSGSLASGDAAAFSETFDTRNVGTGKTLTAAGSVSDGNSGSNYALTLAANTTGQITARPITVIAATNTKSFDGTTSAAATPTIPPGIPNVVTTLAGSAGQSGSADGTGSAARFNFVSGVAVDSAGNVYVADTFNQDIRKVTPSGVVTTLAGLAPWQGSSDGTGSAARFDCPMGVAVDSAGNVYVADEYNDEIRKVTPSGVVTTLAGSVGQTGSSDGTGSAARFYDPTGIAVDSAGNLYVADDNNDEIRKITPSGVVTTLAGAAGQSGSTNGTGSAAEFAAPQGVAVDSAGNVYVADTNNHDIRKITPLGVVTTLAGSAGQTGSNDGTGTTARFFWPTGVTLDSAGNVYVADQWNDEIRKITPSGVVTSLAGSAGLSGSSNGIGGAARFDLPFSVAMDSAGNISVADRYNAEVRLVTPNPAVVPGDTAAFSEIYDTANVGTGKTLTPAGSVNDGNGGNNYAVTFAVNTTGTIVSGTLTLTTTTLSTSQASVVYGTPLTFTATVAAQSGSTAPGANSVDFFDTTTNHDLGLGTFGGSAGTISTWTFTSGVKTLNVAAADTITATYAPGGNFAASSGATTQTVTPRAITVAATSSTKTYDGTTTSGPAPTITGGSLVGGDTAAFAETFGGKNVGSGKTLTPGGSVSDGNGGSNYMVTFIANSTGSVTVRAITVTAAPSTKFYDGTTSSNTTPAISSGSLAAGDTAAFSETFDTPALGTGKTLTPAGSVSDGNGGNNYTLTFAVNTAGTILVNADDSTTLVWPGPGSVLSLTDSVPGDTPSIAIPEPTPGVSRLKIDLGAGYVFATGSTTAATGLTYQNAGSPTTSEYATIDISTAGNVSSLVATLPGDYLTLGQIRDTNGGAGSISASAGTIEVTGISTASVNGNVNLAATGNLTVDAGASILTGAGTISLAADVNANGTGDDGVGTLSIGAGAVVDSTNASASAITLRAAAVNIDTSANPAFVGATPFQRLSTVPTIALTGLNDPLAMIFDTSGNLYVTNQGNGTVSKFAPGATTPSATLTGLNNPFALAFDASGNLYVANQAGTTVSKFAPGATTPTATLTGLNGPCNLAIDTSGNLYVANFWSGTSGTVSKFAPGAMTPTATLTGLEYPLALDFDTSGNLYVANWWSPGTVSKFAPGATTPTATLTGTATPEALAFDSSGNLYVTDEYGTIVGKYAPGTTTPSATLTGLNDPQAMAFDATGNLYVSNEGGTTVSEFAPGATTPNTTFTGLSEPQGLAFDASGNLYVANNSGTTVSKFTMVTVAVPTAGGVVIRSSLPTRPMSIGGTNNAVAGINLTDAELAQIYTTAGGTVTLGDSSQTGNITCTTATPATTAGASTVVVQSATGPGQIVLDDTGSGTGLSGNGGSVTLTPGTGGILTPLNASGVPLATQGFNATGLTLSLSLNFAPTVGTQLTLINNTTTPASSHPITGVFANLPQGGTIWATYSGTAYWFQANYAAGDGNDLVLTAISATTTTTLSSSQPSASYGTPVTFTATVTAQSGSTAPSAGSVDFYDTTTSHNLGLGTLGSTSGLSSTWTYVTGVKTLNVTAGDTITAAYASGTGLGSSSGTTTQTVTAIPITVTAATSTKGYDGTTSSTAVPTLTSGGLLSGDTLAFTETFASKNAGTAKTLIAAGSVIDSNSGSNYAVTFVANTTGQITLLAITVTAASATKVYDGTVSSTASPTITAGSLASGDTAAFTDTFDTKNVGTGKTLTVAGSVNDGNGGSNYAVTLVTNTTGQVTPRAITVTAATSTKTYDGTLASTAVPIIGGGGVSTLAGSAGKTGFSNGTGSTATFYAPADVAVDSAGNVYVGDQGNDEIRKITPSGVVTTLAGSPGQIGSSDGTGSAARFFDPWGVTVDSAGNVYVADLRNDEIRKITPSGVVTTLAGSASHIGSSNGTGSAAYFSAPFGVAVDSVGNVYVADSSNDEIRKITPSGVVTTLAGAPGQLGSSDGTGSAARFRGPGAVAVDSAGNVYVADYGSQEIRKITPAGVVSTLAGSAMQSGSSDGTGSAARFYNPTGVAVDSAGNVYVADSYNQEIREITPFGVVSTLAGSAGQIGSSDGAFSAAGFDYPQGVAVDGAGNVYVADLDNQEIRMVSPNTGLASGDTAAFTETFDTKNVGLGKSLTPAGSVNDGNGGSNYTVTFVTNTTGQITPLAITVTAAASSKTYDGTISSTATPTVTSGSLPSGDTAAFSETFATRNAGTGETLTAAGSVNDGDGGSNYTVTFVANATGQITPLAITVTAATATKVYDGTTSSTASPTIIAGSLAAGDTAAFTDTFDTKNVGTGKTLTVAGSVNDGNGGSNYAATIVTNATGQITPRAITVNAATSTKVYDGATSSTATPTIASAGPGIVTTLAGSAGQSGSSNGTGSAARFYYPQSVAVDSAGNAYVADMENDDIRKITPSGVVTTLAGAAGQAGSSDGTGSAARFKWPSGVALDSAGNIYVADYSNDEIRKITPSGVVTTLAGSAGQTGSSDGTGSAARFYVPTGVAVDIAGNVYVGDTGNQTIRKITPSGVVTTLAGTAGVNGSSNGTGSAARFSDPMGVTVDSAGNVYVGDYANDEIRIISPSGVVTTLAGSAWQRGSSDGTGSAARFADPYGVAVDGMGNVYVADYANDEIREITPSGVVTTVAGSAGQIGSSNGIGSAARFDYPQGVALDSAGNVYVADNGNDEIRQLSGANAGLVAGDTAAFTESFDTRNIGTGKTLTPFGSVNDGNGGSNYTVTFVANTTGQITPLAITVTAVASSKIYDGTALAAVSPIITAGSLAAGDTAAFSESFSTRNVGTGETLTPAGSVSDGNGGGNYTVSVAPGTAGVITVRAITVTAASNTKTYDGTNSATVAPLVIAGSLATGDTPAFSETFSNRNVGTVRTLAAAGSVNDGNHGANYAVTFAGSAIGQITPRAITLTAATSTKTYDGTTSAPDTPTITAGSLGAGDTLACIEVYDSKNAGTGKTLFGLGSVNDNNNGNNYALTFVATDTGQITPLAITVAAADSTKTYDGTTSAPDMPAITAGSLVSNTVSVLAGFVGQKGASDGVGDAARLDYPSGVAVDSAGNVYVADTNNQEIRKISPSGVVTTLAGSAGQTGSSDGTGNAARFDLPEGLAVDCAGNVYVADTVNQEIREISPAGVVTTLAGSAGQRGASDGTGSAASFNSPYGVAVDSAGNVYVVDTNNQEIREISPAGVVSTLAGSAGRTGSSDGAGSAARFDYPFGVAVDETGNVYVADYSNDAIREISPAGVVSTLAGSAGQAGSGDGTGSAARLSNPTGVAVDTAGNVYVADYHDQEIRKISPSGVATTLAGSVGQMGSSDGVASAARFDYPFGVAVDNGGNVYVADYGNQEIRLIGGDTASFSETFDTKNAGTGKTLNAAGSVNDRNNGNNYAVTFVANTAGSVAVQAITVAAASSTKTYDGATSTPTAPTITAGSLATGDAAAFIETFDTTNVAASATLTAAGSVNDGNGGSNYALTFLTDTTGQITPLAITVTAASSTKTYDGSTSTTAAPAITAGSLVAGDTAAFAETFGTANAGTDETLIAAGSVSDGNGGANYAVTFVPDTTGQITPLAITVTAASSTKTYDGTTSTTAAPAITAGSLVAGDAAAFIETFDTTNAGTGETFIAAGSVSDGNGGANYAVTFVPDTTGQITPLAITVTAASSTKTYDDSTFTTATPAITAGDLVAGDTAAFTETFDTKSAGTGKTLTATGSVNDGNGGDNYAVSFVTNATGQIAARAITVTAASSTKNYDGTASAAVKPTITAGSLAAGDVAAFSESYDNPNAGTGKTLTPAGSVNDGDGGEDYAVSFVANTTGTISAVTATAAKLMLTETSSSTVVSGHDVVYTITLKNLGPGAAQNVVISDNLAANGLSYVSDPVPSGCTASTPAVGCTGMVTFTAPLLAAGASATFTLVAGVGPTALSNTSLSNKVSVCCATPLSSSSVTAASVQAQVNAAGASLAGSSLDTGQTDLVVTGTAGSDTIYVLPAGNQLLVVDDGRAPGPFAAPTGRIVVYSGNGNDMVFISPLLRESSWIFGGAGNDTFYADSGNSVLVGGSGNNVLFSGRGDNILIGGRGHTTIMGTQGNNVEVGGSVNCEANEAALAAILAEWSSGDSYATRLGRLDGVIGGGLNGSWVLNASTIDHGPSGDYLFGGIGQNSYFARQTGPVLARDYIFGQKSSERITSI